MTSHGVHGRLIAGRYRLAAPLGRGGMGVVWRATDELLGREVAVKELHIEETVPADDARQHRERTLREARTVAQVRHPHVVVLHDVVVDDGHPFIVMELIEGGSLADRLARHGPLTAVDAAELCLALLGALREAHASGVLHRDLKPSNVLLEAGTGRVVLSDFGIAQVAGFSTLTESGSFVGSPEYTAPERISGGRAGPASDLWSLGVLLCTALSGQSPFRRDSLGAVVHAVLMDDVRPPPEAGPLLPVVRGLLERDPDRRIDTAQAERLLRAYVTTAKGVVAGAVAGAVMAGRGGAPAPSRSALSSRSAPPGGRAPAAAPARRWSPLRLLAPLARTPGWPPVRLTRRRTVLIAVLVAVVAAAGISAVALLIDRGRDRGEDPGPGERTRSAAPPAPLTYARGGPETYARGPVAQLRKEANRGKSGVRGHGSVTGLELVAPRAIKMGA
ncbi:serine/threonine-protein kinase [Streptomyces apocyni]|uniref:serine/threonine-protein kinase n=1 Tax=Streptomyces apocyni TaxID=2654677 RepID=UPI0012EA4813|nr:serine/threonine-protein kinase [Streptomyces apocyni]